MRNSLISAAVLGCFMAEHTEQVAGGATVASLTKGKPLSGLIVKAFFDGSDAKKVQEKVAAAEGSRLNYLLRTFPESDVTTVKNATKEYRDDVKKQHGDKSKEYRVAKVRASNIGALYGAWRFCEFRPDGMGFHASVTAATEMLKDKGIRWSGDRIPEKWEKDIRKGVEQEAQVALAAKMEVARAEKASGEPLTEEQEKAIWAKAAEQKAKADMVALSAGLIKKYGAEKCEQLIEALENGIHAMQQAAKDKTATAKVAAVG